LRTGNEDIGEYLQKRKLPKNDYNCNCGVFHTTQHTVKYCKKKKRHLKRSTLRAITRHGLSPVVKHTKEGSKNEGMLLMVIETVKKGRKNSVQRRNSRKISYKFKRHIAYNRDKLRLQWFQS